MQQSIEAVTFYGRGAQAKSPDTKRWVESANSTKVTASHILACGQVNIKAGLSGLVLIISSKREARLIVRDYIYMVGSLSGLCGYIYHL
ncbi:MAG TPA: hypothetical protein VFI68_10025 [Anaerolineales bacterium]|nr:hypothetical protein [Anaerolineales bacterium]